MADVSLTLPLMWHAGRSVRPYLLVGRRWHDSFFDVALCMSYRCGWTGGNILFNTRAGPGHPDPWIGPVAILTMRCWSHKHALTRKLAPFCKIKYYLSRRMGARAKCFWNDFCSNIFLCYFHTCWYSWMLLWTTFWWLMILIEHHSILNKLSIIK